MSNDEGPAAPTVAAYYYPGWTRNTLRTIRNRAGASEWDLLFDAAARESYPDVRRPMAGPAEPSIQSLEAECVTASSWGIDAFIWCWYWERGRELFNETLDLFLRCRLPSGFRYALMWVNKRPHFHLPLTSPSERIVRERMIHTDAHDFAAMIDYLAARHWSRDGYLVIDRRPVLMVFHVDYLVDQLGPATLQTLLDHGDSIARRNGFAGVQYVGIAHRLTRVVKSGPTLRDIGFRAISNYVYLPDWSGPPTQDYQALVRRRAAEWPLLSRLHDLPLWPSISCGWDARPRGQPVDHGAPGYPWVPRVTGETPDGFFQALEYWRQFSDGGGRAPVLPVASWNEWTEGHAIAPCDRHGDGMLRALRAFKQSYAAVAQSTTERRLCRIVAEALGIETVPADADFLAVGGHSLTAVRAAALVAAEFDVELDIEDFFSAGATIGRIAATIDGLRTVGHAPPLE
jgi:acyl carrier protein